MIYLLDLIGVFAFAFCGARVALDSRFGAFGVLACAFLPALGGGTVRELLLDRTPGYLTQPEYLGTVLAAALLAAATQRHAERLSPTITAMDAIGVVTFAYIGAHAAVGAGFPLVGVLFVAVVTAGTVLIVKGDRGIGIGLFIGWAAGLIVLPLIGFGLCVATISAQ